MSAESACSVPNDQWAFTRGIILLHDAAESALGAVADHLHAIKDPQKNVYLLHYCDLIQKADPDNSSEVSRAVPYQQQLRSLNTLRNAAKHSGILPDQKSNAHFPTTVTAFISDICHTYLNIDFTNIRLTSLIRNEKVRALIEDAAQYQDKGDYEKALISLGFAMFHVVDSEAVPWTIFDDFLPRPLRKATPKEVFPDFYDVKHAVRLLQRGIDPHLHSRFHLLTPRIGRDTASGDAIYRWEKEYGHPANWTEQNVSFCMRFCVDAALQAQREAGGDYSITPYSSVYEDVIEVTGGSATIWDISSDTSDYFPRVEPYIRKPLLVLQPGEILIGKVSDQERKPHEWAVMFEVSLPGQPPTLRHGYLAKSEVTITRREKQAP
jgi:hypothetical protein